MAAKRYRASAHFPSIDKGVVLQVEAVAGNWAAALGKCARELKRQLKRRRITAMSITLQQVGSALEPAANPEQAALPMTEQENE